MDLFGGSSRDSAITAFRECLSKYKHMFNKVTITASNKQDTAEATEVIRLIDDLYKRLFAILTLFKNGSEPRRPTQDSPVEYTFFTDGKVEYLYKDRDAVDEFLRYLYIDLRQFPFTYDVGLIESYNGIPIEAPTIISNSELSK
jgi:hypothetical protein